jgi:peptidoglycan hydrolase-like protein with peptidoglycan-binding domain
MNLGLNLPVTGYYGSATIAGVNQFQVKYHIEVLKPWLPLGLPTQFTPTSYVYQTTQRWINLIMCPSLNLSVPQLVVDQGGE